MTVNSEMVRGFAQRLHKNNYSVKLYDLDLLCFIELANTMKYGEGGLI